MQKRNLLPQMFVLSPHRRRKNPFIRRPSSKNLPDESICPGKLPLHYPARAHGSNAPSDIKGISESPRTTRARARVMRESLARMMDICYIMKPESCRQKTRTLMKHEGGKNQRKKKRRRRRKSLVYRLARSFLIKRRKVVVVCTPPTPRKHWPVVRGIREFS